MKIAGSNGSSVPGGEASGAGGGVDAGAKGVGGELAGTGVGGGDWDGPVGGPGAGAGPPVIAGVETTAAAAGATLDPMGIGAGVAVFGVTSVKIFGSVAGTTAALEGTSRPAWFTRAICTQSSRIR